MTGQLIHGRYRVEGRLGVGGMSTVYLAHDERLGRPVAIKLLAEHLAEDRTFVARFQREARAAARLVHPNIVQVFDSGLDEESHRHYIVMEHVPGRSCAELLRDQGRLPVEEVLAIVGQACHGLDYAHRNGVVHRDVKPGNLLRTPEGVVKLADFGIAKGAGQSSITQVGSVLGTAAYLAPEQARGEEAGPAADLYALGVVAYQLLSGRLPYESRSLSELALKQQRELPPRLDALTPEVGPELATAVARALALDAAERYPDALAMEAALRDGARGIAPPAPAPTRVIPRTDELPAPRAPRRPSPPPVGRAPVATPPPAAPPAPRRRGGFGRALATLLTIVALAAGAGVAVLASQPSGRVKLRDVSQQVVSDAVRELRALIADNTR